MTGRARGRGADLDSDSVERLFVIERIFGWADPVLIAMGSMFGLLFFALGAATAFSKGADVGLLALGTALVALGRAASAASYARRNRCRCGGRGAGAEEMGEGGAGLGSLRRRLRRQAKLPVPGRAEKRGAQASRGGWERVAPVRRGKRRGVPESTAS